MKKRAMKWLLGLCVALVAIIGFPPAGMAAEDAETTPKTSEDPYGSAPADAPARKPCVWTIMEQGGGDARSTGDAVTVTEGATVVVRASCDVRGKFRAEEGISSPNHAWIPASEGARGLHEFTFTAPAYNTDGGNTQSLKFVWDGGDDGRSETKTFTVNVEQEPASKAEVEEVSDRVDDIERSYGRTFWLTGGLLWGPNDSAQTGNAWGVELASAYRVIQPDPVGMKLGFSLRDRWSSVRVNENVYATTDDVPEHITTAAARVLLNLELAHWIDLDLGAELGAARLYRDQTVLAQYADRRIELDKDYTRWTPVVGGYAAVNFYPTKHLVLGVGVDADYNTRAVSRIAANDESGADPVDGAAGDRGFIITCHYFIGWTW